MGAVESGIYQADMFGPRPLARATDPSTSHQAALSMVGEAGTQRREILDALRTTGPKTADELDELLGLRLTSAGRRLIELARTDPPLARRLPAKRTTRSGRAAHLWEAIGYETKDRE